MNLVNSGPLESFTNAMRWASDFHSVCMMVATCLRLLPRSYLKAVDRSVLTSEEAATKIRTTSSNRKKELGGWAGDAGYAHVCLFHVDKEAHECRSKMLHRCRFAERHLVTNRGDFCQNFRVGGEEQRTGAGPGTWKKYE